MNLEDKIDGSGLIYKIKKFISETTFSSYFMILILKYLVAGFVFGFLFKTFGRFVFLALIISFTAVWLLDSVGLITVNFNQFQSVLGISSQESITNNINLLFEWIKNNIALFITFCLGFYLAWEIM